MVLWLLEKIDLVRVIFLRKCNIQGGLLTARRDKPPPLMDLMKCCSQREQGGLWGMFQGLYSLQESTSRQWHARAHDRRGNSQAFLKWAHVPLASYSSDSERKEECSKSS